MKGKYLLKNKFKNYYGLKRYLSVVAKNNNHDINFDNYSGLESIYNYLNLHRDKVSYNFNFSEWIKLSAINDINELQRISGIGLSINNPNKFNEDIIYKFGLKAFAISNVDKDTICTYTRPSMSTNIGCYFIYDNNESLVYIGKSTSDLLTRACVSSVQRVLGDFSKIELLEFSTKAETNIFEIYYISKLKPKFNSESNTKDILPFDIPDNFGIIYFDELEKILNFKEELKGVRINDEEIDLTRMSSAYILLLLSYLRVNMNRNLDKPLCCYRLYQKITDDIGLSERYVSRIVEILDVMNIIKYQEGKRIRYKKQEDKYGFLTTPKVFADYRHFVKDIKGNQIIDIDYDFRTEIQKQLDILEENQKQI